MKFIDIYGMGGILKLTVDSKSEKKNTCTTFTRLKLKYIGFLGGIRPCPMTTLPVSVLP